MSLLSSIFQKERRKKKPPRKQGVFLYFSPFVYYVAILGDREVCDLLSFFFVGCRVVFFFFCAFRASRRIWGFGLPGGPAKKRWNFFFFFNDFNLCGV